MAWYKYDKFLKVNHHANFDTSHHPGADAPDPGIYRCTACGHEIGIAKGHKLPPQGHHAHAPNIGAIQWQLIVCAAN